MLDVSVTKELHIHRFGQVPTVFAAPGRVNIIGEHTDYAEGFVMPAAIDFATLATISRRSDDSIVIGSENYKEQVSHCLTCLPEKAIHHWSDYPLGERADKIAQFEGEIFSRSSRG